LDQSLIRILNSHLQPRSASRPRVQHPSSSHLYYAQPSDIRVVNSPLGPNPLEHRPHISLLSTRTGTMTPIIAAPSLRSSMDDPFRPSRSLHSRKTGWPRCGLRSSRLHLCPNHFHGGHFSFAIVPSCSRPTPRPSVKVTGRRADSDLVRPWSIQLAIRREGADRGESAHA